MTSKKDASTQTDDLADHTPFMVILQTSINRSHKDIYILYIYKWRTDLLGGFPSCPPADDVFPLKRVRCFIYVVFQNTYIAPYEIRLRRYSKAFMAISALQWTTIDVF